MEAKILGVWGGATKSVLGGQQPEVTSGGAASAAAGISEPWLAYDCTVLRDPDWGPLRKWARLEHVILAGGSLQGGF